MPFSNATLHCAGDKQRHLRVVNIWGYFSFISGEISIKEKKVANEVKLTLRGLSLRGLNVCYILVLDGIKTKIVCLEGMII